MLLSVLRRVRACANNTHTHTQVNIDAQTASIKQPSCALRYLVERNLAKIYETQSNNDEALRHLLMVRVSHLVACSTRC